MDIYRETAKRWIQELQMSGKMKGLDDQTVDRQVDDYARRLEEIFHEEVVKQLQPMGKAAEFDRMMLYDGQYINKYLNQTIAGFPAFRMEVFSRARKIILGE